MDSLLPISGYEGLYVVSATGHVFALAKSSKMPRGGYRQHPHRLLRTSKDRGGYLIVTLSKEGRAKRLFVHRVVCAAFHGAPGDESWQVNHKDGDKTNNTASNLEWCTASVNVLHSFRNLQRAPSHCTPVKGLDPRTGEVVATFASVADAGRSGYSPTNISSCLNGRLKTSGGLKWRRV